MLNCADVSPSSFPCPIQPVHGVVPGIPCWDSRASPAPACEGTPSAPEQRLLGMLGRVPYRWALRHRLGLESPRHPRGEVPQPPWGIRFLFGDDQCCAHPNLPRACLV